MIFDVSNFIQSSVVGCPSLKLKLKSVYINLYIVDRFYFEINVQCVEVEKQNDVDNNKVSLTKLVNDIIIANSKQ